MVGSEQPVKSSRLETRTNMPRFGVRSVVTYMLVAASIASRFLGQDITSVTGLDSMTMLALGFLFAKPTR